MLFNDALDDSLQVDECSSFNGGMVDTPQTRPDQININQVQHLKNIDIQLYGTARTRRGSISLGTLPTYNFVQGLLYFDTPDDEFIISVADGKVYKWNGSYWLQINDLTVETSSPVSLAMGINTMYVADGVNSIKSWDGTTVSDLGSVDNDEPPIAQYLLWHTNRLFATGVDEIPDAIYVSDILDGTTWDKIAQQFRVGAGESDRIVGLSPWDGFDLAVLKRSSIWVVNCDPEQDIDEWSIRLINKKIGCVANRSVVQVGKDVWFLSDDGVRSIQRSISGEQNEVSEPISAPIQSLIDRIHWEYASQSCAAFWKNRYLLAVPLDDSTIPNTVLVYNTQTQSWSGYWTGWTPTVFTTSFFEGEGRLHFGQTNGKVRKWLEYIAENDEVTDTYKDDNEEIDSELITRALIFNDPIHFKQGSHAEVEFSYSQSVLNIEVIRDDNMKESIIENLNSDLNITCLPIELPFAIIPPGIKRYIFDLMKFDSFRELQFKISSSSKKIVVRRIMAFAFTDHMLLESN
jgi:hypothetical protein